MIYKSPFDPVEVPPITITECLMEGLGGDPDRVVLVDGPSGREMTAARLAGGIRALAGGLTEAGFGAGQTVALMAPNIPEYALVFHAVAWAGGTITTINPTYTDHEVKTQLQDSGATLLVTVPPLRGTAETAIAGTQVRRVVMIGEDGPDGLLSLMGTALPAQVAVDPADHVVALPYSSGTTGMPKGVMLTHRNLVANVAQTAALLPVAPGERTVAFLPFFHIYGMTVLLNAFLAGGGALITLPRFDLEMFLRLTQEHRAPKMLIVPPVALALAKHPLVDEVDLSAVKQIFSGAAPLGADLGSAAADRIGAVMTEGYGMTELSPVSHLTPIDAPRPGSAGPTVPNCESRVVDPETLVDVAEGAEGELLVRGPNVMKGYLNNTAATDETIIDGGWLRTGDLCVIDGDGYLFIRDRVKELIKYKGFQVAPAELEAELVGHPAIRDAAVIGRPDPESGEVPVAFVVPAEGADLDADGVKAHLAGRLSSYKQLHDVTFVEEIPKSASGKILRRHLST